MELQVKENQITERQEKLKQDETESPENVDNVPHCERERHILVSKIII